MENNENTKQHFIKINFFQKIWYSISKFEKYPEMAALGVKSALLYFVKLMIIVSIIFTGVFVYYTKNIAEYDEKLNLSEKITNELTRRINMQDEVIDIDSLKNEDSGRLIITIGISLFVSLFLGTLLDVFLLSLFGILTCMIAKIKMHYKALFNMSIYAFTLSILLRVIYFIITTLTTFKIKYFDIMYIAISYISLAAAIFLIKSNVIKQHLELMKIIEESKEKIEETFPIHKKPKDEEKEDNEDENNDEEEKKEDETEGQGSNA